jgi:hypothetical protein
MVNRMAASLLTVIAIATIAATTPQGTVVSTITVTKGGLPYIPKWLQIVPANPAFQIVGNNIVIANSQNLLSEAGTRQTLTIEVK